MKDAPLLHLPARPRLWADWAAHHQQAIDNAYQGLRFDQFSMVTSAAVGALGVALLPTYLIEKELEQGALVPVSNLTISTENAYYVVRPDNRLSQPSAIAFEDWLLREVQSIAS